MNSIVKFRPAAPATNFSQNYLPDFFNLGLPPFAGFDHLITQPAVNIVESPSGFRIDVAAPGFTRESFEAKIENDLLIISGKTENEPENKAEKFTTRQFNYHSFQKTYKLPKSVNQENISAFYKEGILTVVLSKKEEAVPASKSISIL